MLAARLKSAVVQSVCICFEQGRNYWVHEVGGCRPCCTDIIHWPSVFAVFAVVVNSNQSDSFSPCMFSMCVGESG